MSESDMKGQKKTQAGLGAEGRQNAVNDAAPDVQSPGMTKETGQEVGNQKATGRAASRGNRRRQH